MMLRVQNVKKTYFQGARRVEVLKGLDLSLSKGETLSVVGPSGSGKSTLLSLLSGLDQPTSGQIEINGTDLAPLSEEELALFRGNYIGLIFQQFHLMRHLTALENVMLPLEILGVSEARNKARQGLQALSLEHRENHFPHELSGGECQRVAIARAMAPSPSLLLADEPSGNLDAETGALVIQELFDLVEKNNMTLVVVTHSPELAHRCERQVLLKSGVFHPEETGASL